MQAKDGETQQLRSGDCELAGSELRAMSGMMAKWLRSCIEPHSSKGALHAEKDDNRLRAQNLIEGRSVRDNQVIKCIHGHIGTSDSKNYAQLSQR